MDFGGKILVFVVGIQFLGNTLYVFSVCYIFLAGSCITKVMKLVCYTTVL